MGLLSLQQKELLRSFHVFFTSFQVIILFERLKYLLILSVSRKHELIMFHEIKKKEMTMKQSRLLI